MTIGWLRQSQQSWRTSRDRHHRRQSRSVLEISEEQLPADCLFAQGSQATRLREERTVGGLRHSRPGRKSRVIFGVGLGKTDAGEFCQTY